MSSDEAIRRVLRAIDDEAPPALEVAERFADATDISVGDAQARVYEAIDGGLLVEDGSGYGGVRLAQHYESDETPKTGDIEPRGAGSSDAETRGKDGENDVSEAADALRDVLRFYNQRVDDKIGDHTDSGEHPERPTTAREYFTEVRGWDDDTVDELLLGWAPPNHSDQLVAWLFDRGHDREAILATGAVGETDSGGFYTTFQGRYVLPYYDGEGEPAYAIARVTGGEGGGAKGYGGHPADYQAGKYAKLRHTDGRVPFEEPIYGLDTLEDGDHVVVAEGIADAITARELGYSVLSPVAKEFKEAHYAPLAEALEEHDVDRVTIVADADGIRNASADEHEPETIGDAVGVGLSPVGAGLAGALRTATKLGERTAADIRVSVPPAPADLTNDLDEFVNGAWGGDLDALLASGKPAEGFDQLDEVVSDDPAAGYDEFDAEEYEPNATSAEETTDDIRDVYAALDRLDAQRVADRTIVSEWLEGQARNRTFAPTWAPSGYTGTANAVNSDRWVDMGDRGGYGGPAVMAAIDADLVRDTNCPGAVSGETWLKAVDHLRDLGFSIPKLERSSGSRGDIEEYRTDPREVEATVDPRRAWDAAGRVTPDELDTDQLEAADSGEAFRAPSGEAVDVVRAVAIAEGLVDDAQEPIAGEYPTAYRLAREEYGAPLPEYYSTADAIAKFDAVLDVIGEVTFFDLDSEVLNTDITGEGDEVGGDAVRALNPSWRDSESEASVLVFESGTVWDADTEQVLDALRFVALDSGLIDGPRDPIAGGDFTEAYRTARDEYGAPLPRWDPALDGDRDVTPQLPDAEELVDTRDLDGVDTDALDEARGEVEDLVGRLARDPEDASVVRALPATGKTTGTVKTARERPLSYLAPRKELQAQALDKADTWGVDAEILPVFSDERVDDEVLAKATAHVREHGKERLRDRWAILTAVAQALDEDTDDLEIFTEEEEDDDGVELDRPTCETADGEHGDAWALAVHVARRLGYTPREIHTQARGLFGAELPCMSGEGCEYSLGWDAVTDADDPADLLVGSYVHAHVESVRTYYEAGPQGVERSPRAVVLDEFPGEAFSQHYGDEALDFATWLAGALREDVDDRRDMFEADLGSDEWVATWLDGETDAEGAVGGAMSALGRFGDLYEARDAAATILDEVDTGALEAVDLREGLSALVDDDPLRAFEAIAAAERAIDDRDKGHGLVRWAVDEVLAPLRRATREGDSRPTVDDVDTDGLPIGGDLAGLVERAVEAVGADEEAAEATVDAATTALRGGRDGCRRLAAWANDGYAHPDAHYFLRGVITPTGEDGDVGARRIDTDAWAFDPDATEGTVVDAVDVGERARVLIDRNGHGATLHTPPARTAGNGDDAPLLGLDATARAELWSVALGEEVLVEDIHDTDAERAEFLEDALDLRVIQAADRPRYYEGDPRSKDTDGDVALLEAIAEEYSGIEAPRQRDDAPDAVGKPAAITTKGVRDLLEDDPRLDDVVDAWDNYGNVKGSNELGDQRLAAVLGCQHYGDHAIERFAALAGEEVDTDRGGGRGAALGYASPVGDAYLSHMTEDQTMQAILRFARGDSGATVVARTSALREDLPVVGDAQVVETWSETATTVAREYRRLGEAFTVADVADTVDVTKRQVRRVLAELADAGYIRRVSSGPGVATEYERIDDPSAGEAELPDRREAVATDEAGRSPINEYYTWNVRVREALSVDRGASSGPPAPNARAPPAPTAADGLEPPS